MDRKANQFIARVLTGMLLCTAGWAYAGEAAHVVFVAGKADIGGQAAVLNAAVNEGAELQTGADGYIYLKTVDNGFFILRPNSKAVIAAYHVDQKEPANTRVKLELVNGVARSISGEAVKQARQNFRFNTPVAAIGVRGTDFTVYTTQETSQVTVISGGVVVSGFGSGCSPQGGGPCEGSNSTELFARQHDQLLQVNKGQIKPQLRQSSGAAPDTIAPPRPDEPSGKAGAAGAGSGNNGSATAGAAPTVNATIADPNLDPKKGASLATVIDSLPTTPVVTPPVVTPPVVVDPNEPSHIIWGRWATVLGQAPTVDFNKQFAQSKFIASNNYFALFQEKNTEWQLPTSGVMGFALKDSSTYVANEKLNQLSIAKLENASLTVDFAKTTFNTSFDVLTGSDRFSRQAQGKVYSDGQFAAQGLYPNTMQVNGVLSAERGGAAAYLFQTRLDDNRVAYGATYWGKK
jgi:hypothetical protein